MDQATREAEALGREARQRMEEYVGSRTRMAETKIAQAEAQAVADVRAAAADAAVSAAEKILSDTVKGKAADDLISRGIGDVKTKLN
jgi:F-type H+-transporting ATPase subunit b